MNDKNKAKKIVSDDGLDIFYWTSWQKDQGDQFTVIHPGSSMNHSSLLSLEKGINEQNKPTIILDPRGVGYSDAPTEPQYYGLSNYSADLQKIVEQEGLQAPEMIGHSFGFMPLVDYTSRTNNVNNLIGICASHKFSETTGNKALFHLFNRVLRYTEYFGSIGTKVSHLLKGDERVYPDQSNLEGKSDYDVWVSIVDIPFRDVKAHTVSGIEINKWDISNQLRNLDIPLLLIYATKDPMVKSKAGDYIQGMVKRECVIETVEGTHSLPIQTPKKVIEVISNYRN